MFTLALITILLSLAFWVKFLSKMANENSDKCIGKNGVNDDEKITFFRTSAWLNENTKAWHIPIHGWIHTPQNSHYRKKAVTKLLKEKYGLLVKKENEEIFNKVINLLMSDNKRGKEITIDIAKKVFTLSKSASNGHFETTLIIPAKELLLPENRILHYHVTPNAEKEGKQRGHSRGEVIFIPPEGKSIISDIDDTVKLSYVNEKRRLIEHTFFKVFLPVPGMVELYQQWEKQGASFHFVSSSPWHIYSLLQNFLNENSFPKSTLSLKKFRFKDKSLMNLFKKGTETKPIAIEAILHSYPKRTFILVGDSGEQDPEVYADIIRRHPNQIEKIYIRKVIGKKSDFDGIFSGIDSKKWDFFENPSTIEYEKN